MQLPPIQGWNRVAIFGAGSGANGLAALFGAFVSVVYFGSPLGLSFFDPLRPDRLLESESLIENGIRVAIWMNAMLCLINLTPIMVFDGGHILLGLVQALSPRSSVIDRAWIVQVVGQSTGIAAVTLAVSLGLKSDGALLHGWFYLLLFGISVIFAARSNPGDFEVETEGVSRARADKNRMRRLATSRELSEFEETLTRLSDGSRGADEADDEFEDFPVEEEESEESLSTWLRERRGERAEQARQREVDEERRADEILDKVHREGIESLTIADREILERVSARYRSRQGEQA